MKFKHEKIIKLKFSFKKKEERLKLYMRVMKCLEYCRKIDLCFVVH